MTDSDARMSAVLDGYAKFLREKDLALPKHQPYLVRWVPAAWPRLRRAHQRPASCSQVLNRFPQLRHPPSLKLRQTSSLLRMSLLPGARLV